MSRAIRKDWQLIIASHSSVAIYLLTVETWIPDGLFNKTRLLSDWKLPAPPRCPSFGHTSGLTSRNKQLQLSQKVESVETSPCSHGIRDFLHWPCQWLYRTCAFCVCSTARLRQFRPLGSTIQLFVEATDLLSECSLIYYQFHTCHITVQTDRQTQHSQRNKAKIILNANNCKLWQLNITASLPRKCE